MEYTRHSWVLDHFIKLENYIFEALLMDFVFILYL